MEPTQSTPAPYQTPTAPTTPPPMAPSPRINPAMTAGAITILVVVTLGAYYMGTQGEGVAVSPSPEPVFCTMDAKICPDGSSVGRTGPNCEFTACPDSTSSVPADWKTYTNTELGFELSFPPTWSDLTTRTSGGTVYFSAPCSSAESTQNEYFLIASQAIAEFEATKQLEIEARGFSSATALGQKNGMQFYATLGGGTTCKQADYGTAMMGETSRILSTFKFIEQASVIPSDWQTYTNTLYGFEFRHPAQWPSPVSYTVGLTGALESFLGQSKWGYEFGIKKDIEGSLSSSYYIAAYPAADRSIILQKLKSSEQYKGKLVAVKDATLTIGGFPAIRYDEGGLCGYPSAMIFTPRYTLKKVSNCNNESSDPFDRILSTFKFTR